MGKMKPAKTKGKALRESCEPLSMDLYSPGMTLLHRAGLGGLVSTLRCLERAAQEGRVCGEGLPGWPWPKSSNQTLSPPWRIDETSVTLYWQTRTEADEFLKRLFAVAFGANDGLIHLPGQYGGLEPSIAVKAALQDGLLLTFLDHAVWARKLGPPAIKSIEIDDQQYVIQHASVRSYTHQKEGAKLATASLNRDVVISRTLYPGVITRHAARGTTAITYRASLLIPLLFAMVGCCALRAGAKRVRRNGKKVMASAGALVIPDFRHLRDAHLIVPALTPRTIREAIVTSAGDAGLAAELRLRAANLLMSTGLNGIRVVRRSSTDWDGRLQQTGSVMYISQADIDDRLLLRYECARACVGPIPKQRKDDGELFWSEEIVLPVITDNLAAGRPWYAGFAGLMGGSSRDRDSQYAKVMRQKKGLHIMSQMAQMWDEASEKLLVDALHQAIRANFGRIKEETQGKGRKAITQATKNRWRAFRDRFRLALVGAKTADQCRGALCGLLSRTGSNAVLQEHWPLVLKHLDPSRWQLTRDLALYALASYGTQRSGDEAESDTDQQGEYEVL